VHLLEPDLDRRHRGILRFHQLIRHCHDFGTGTVIAETGGPDPRPSEPPREDWAELCTILEEALRLASECGVTVLLKPGPSQRLASVADAVQLWARIPHPQLGFVMDAASFLLTSRPAELARDLDELCERL